MHSSISYHNETMFPTPPISLPAKFLSYGIISVRLSGTNLSIMFLLMHFLTSHRYETMFPIPPISLPAMYLLLGALVLSACYLGNSWPPPKSYAVAGVSSNSFENNVPCYHDEPTWDPHGTDRGVHLHILRRNSYLTA